MSRRYAFLANERALKGGSPFSNAELMSSLGIAFTDDIRKADLIFAQALKEVTEALVAPGRPVVTWTAEPKWDQNDKAVVRDYLGGGDAHVFNVYNWNVYTDSFRIGPWARPAPEKTRATFDASTLERASVAVYATFRKAPVVIRGRDVALDTYRGQLALDLHALGRCDIRGRNWPDGVAVGCSREGKFAQIKWEELTDYPFSLCCENTDFDYYVTEKFWDSIRGGALPIYYPNRLFYLNVPHDSFIDLRQPYADTPEKLIEFIDKMSADEYIERYNRCLSVFNTCVANRWRFESVARSSEIISTVLAGL